MLGSVVGDQFSFFFIQFSNNLIRLLSALNIFIDLQIMLELHNELMPSTAGV